MYQDSSPEHFEVAIMGAGFSGLGCAIALRRDGCEDFVVLERAAELGGTWRDNTYPGCACDIPSVLYSWTDEQNPHWSRAFASQQEIWDYMRGVVERHAIAPRIRFGHEVRSARWVAERGHWRIETGAGELTAGVVISAVGALADPAIPALPGLGRFAGTTFHSSRWNHDHDLRGREVAVIGTGASAIQFVPEIQPQVKRLHLFQRTPPWVLPRGEMPIPQRWTSRFERHPWLLGAVRGAVFSLLESFHFAFKHPSLMRLVERRARRFIASQVPDPALREQLTPSYRMGCKRVLASDTWYPAICSENVELVSAGIREVVPGGIVDGDGVEHRVDTIVFGTGFRPTDPPIGHRVTGREGVTLAERWRGSPQAHLGITVAGFPNLFLLLGPNTGLGHNSVLLMIEAQVEYVRQALAYRRRHGVATIEPRPEVQAHYVAEVDRRTRGSVWTAGGCLSWYIDVTGRNSTLWPGSVRAYQRAVARFHAGEYLLQRSKPGTVPQTDVAVAA
ncbi:MAG: NAD(P)/FAD-dependent oxidoreductase [Solirubrobacterales bacterium]|nr:NAD(P)/FAD-dependent oxidoreductase [Solirubrobacterales bacterium]